MIFRIVNDNHFYKKRRGIVLNRINTVKSKMNIGWHAKLTDTGALQARGENIIIAETRRTLPSHFYSHCYHFVNVSHHSSHVFGFDMLLTVLVKSLSLILPLFWISNIGADLKELADAVQDLWVCELEKYTLICTNFKLFCFPSTIVLIQAIWIIELRACCLSALDFLLFLFFIIIHENQTHTCQHFARTETQEQEKTWFSTVSTAVGLSLAENEEERQTEREVLTEKCRLY